MHAEDPFEEPAGGGAVAAVQLARLAGEAVLVTALGEDEHGRRSVERLGELGVQVWAARRRSPRAPRRHSLTEPASARSPRSESGWSRCSTIDEIPWGELAQMDAVYFTAGDAAAMRAARSAGVLVSSPRALHALGHGIELDALVLSAEDAEERRRGDPR